MEKVEKFIQISFCSVRRERGTGIQTVMLLLVITILRIKIKTNA